MKASLRYKPECPTCRAKLAVTDLVVNRALREEINERLQGELTWRPQATHRPVEDGGAKSVTVFFEVLCNGTVEGQHVAIAGSGSELGDWNHLKSLPCTTNSEAFPVWTGCQNFAIDKGVRTLEFKLIIVSPKSDSKSPPKAKWEPGPNRVLQIFSGQMYKVMFSCWREDENEDIDEKVQFRAFRSLSLRHKLRPSLIRMMSVPLPHTIISKLMSELTMPAEPSKTVLLQGFNWESHIAGGGDWYSVVQESIPKMLQLGITDVWLPPPSESVDKQGYMPGRLFNLDSSYGTKTSLMNLIKALHDNGIRAMADIVINHRCGDQQDVEGNWNKFSCGRPDCPGSPECTFDWESWAIVKGSKFSDDEPLHRKGIHEIHFDGASNISHQDQRVRDTITAWLRWLRWDIGFDGWRFDLVRGYSASAVSHYCETSAPSWAVGEHWGDRAPDDREGDREDARSWLRAAEDRCSAFDFGTKYALQQAVSDDDYTRLEDAHMNPSGLVGICPAKTVTFVENHDTGSTQNKACFLQPGDPIEKLLIGYAYILTHPGIPCIFWDHVMDMKELYYPIKGMLQARQEANLPCEAPVHIRDARKGLYLAEVGKPPVLRVALGKEAQAQLARETWKLAIEGAQFRIWVRRQPHDTPPPP